MNSFSDGAFEIRSNDFAAHKALYKTLGVMPTIADVSFSRWKDDELLGVVMYQRYTHTAITMHAVSYEPNWLSRDFLWLVFHYPFVQLGCERVFALVHSGNDRALEFDRKVGFRIETRIGKVYPDGDQIVLVMERADCRWLKIKPKGVKFNRDYDG
jgi:RimJ/RimL family protein N-acetyltransferase